MAEEIVTVVDARNRNPRRENRSRVIANRLTHRGIVVFVVNSEGEMFLQRRSERKKVYPGCWDASCAGTVGWGESFVECARRELYEELTLGARPSELRKVGRPFRVTTEKTDEFDQLFVVRNDGPFSLQRAEVAEGKWVPVAELPALITRELVTPWFSIAWRRHGKRVAGV